jgi:hypothetical protein
MPRPHPGSGGRAALAFARLTALLAAALCMLAAPAAARPWNVSVEPPQGLPLLSVGGAPAMSSAFVFWQKDWKFSGLEPRLRIEGPLAYALTGRNGGLDFDLAADIRKTSESEITWTFALHARSTFADAIGGGMSFRFDLAAFRGVMGEPELLAGNRGFAWGRAGGPRIEMRFDPPLASLYFERGQKSEIRAYFYANGVQAGERRHVATLEATGGVTLAPSSPERFGLADPREWPADVLDFRASPVDLSFLNSGERPAGRRGFVRVAGDRLVFEDGTPVRFWGTNLSGPALFQTSPAGIAQQARRLSQLGFNLVRLHHHDSAWVAPNIFGAAAVPATQSLDPAMLEKIDAWIAALKAEGIYVWLDLHVGRQLKAGDDITAFDEIRKGAPSADLRGFSYVNESIQAAMKRFNQAYVGRVNLHTGIAYKDEPAIAGMLITNENDLTSHFGNSLLPDKNVPWHNAIYMREAAAFADAKGLPRDATWRSWQHGPSKLFLNDLERRFHAEMIRHLRAQGVRVPLATTNQWGYNPLSSLPALTAGSLVDGHGYGGVGELDRNPLHAATFVHWLAAGQVAGLPYTVTEWNVEAFPAPDRHAAPLYLAASAAHQGWAAAMHYAYAQVPLDAGHGPSNWHGFNDPAAIATLPAAALLFRRGDVRPATTTYVFAPGRDALFNRPITPALSVALRTAVEHGRLLIAMPATPELPWLTPSPLPANAVLLSDPDRSLLPPDAQAGASDTGELRRDWTSGLYTVNTPRTQLAAGWLGGKAVDLPDVQVRVETRHASVVVQSLSDAPIAASRTLLVSLGSRAQTVEPWRMPYRFEPVVGELRVRAPPGLRVYAASGPQAARREVNAAYVSGRYVIRLDPSLAAYSLLIAASGGAGQATRLQ